MGRKFIAIVILTIFLVGCTVPQEFGFESCKNSKVVLLPHHLLVEDYIEKMYQSVKGPKRVIIVSPNHFDQGRQEISTANEAEHGFTVHRDMVQKFYPEAEIQGYMIKNGTDSETLQTFAKKLTKQNALLIFSVDFSHYLTGQIAFVHDMRSKDIIESRSIEEASTLEVDSPESIEVMLRVLEEKNQTLEILKYTNPSLDLQVVEFENTTHFFGCSKKANPPERTMTSQMFFAHPKEWYLGKTQEDRYLYGYDEMHFDQGGTDHAILDYRGGSKTEIELDYF